MLVIVENIHEKNKEKISMITHLFHFNGCLYSSLAIGNIHGLLLAPGLHHILRSSCRCRPHQPILGSLDGFPFPMHLHYWLKSQRWNPHHLCP